MDDLTRQIIELKMSGSSWTEIDALYPDIKRETLRSRYRRAGIPTCNIVGIVAGEPPDEDEVYARAVTEWERQKRLEERRDEQYFRFSHGPVALVFAADLHLGGHGVDYPRLFAEAELIAATPGMFLILVGDVVDNFIIGRLIRLRMGARLTITDEWVLLRRYLRIVAPKVVASVGGNHDYWMTILAGIDYLRDAIAMVSPGAIYDQDDAKVTVDIDGVEWPGRIRHKWRGKSIYNDTHGIERAAKWDQDFLWGVGAHDHASGLARGFNKAGRSGMAVKCGSYKRFDKYARQGGFPKHNNSTAVAIVFDDKTESMTGFENLEMCARFMRELYANEEAD